MACFYLDENCGHFWELSLAMVGLLQLHQRYFGAQCIVFTALFLLFIQPVF